MTAVAEHQDSRLRRAIKRMIRLFKIGGAAFPRDLYASLNLSDVSAIAFLGEHDGAIMRDVAQELEAALSTATTVVDRLVRKGLVARTRDDANRRIVRVALTAAGANLYAGMVHDELENCQAILAVLTEDERVAYLAMMEKISSRLAAPALGDLP